MRSRFWLAGLGLAAVLGLPSPANAGGPGVGIVKIHGTVEIKSEAPGSHWRRAKRGELYAPTTHCLLRTGPRSWAHLRYFDAPKSPRSNVGCVELNSLLRIRSNCGHRIEVVRGTVSAVDGKPGKSLFRIASR